MKINIKKKKKKKKKKDIFINNEDIQYCLIVQQVKLFNSIKKIKYIINTI